MPLCANATTIMTQCCAGAQVVPYHSEREPGSNVDNIPENFTDMNALWCHVENSSFATFFDCIGANSPMGICSTPLEGQKARAGRSVTTGVKTIVGVVAMVALFHGML